VLSWQFIILVLILFSLIRAGLSIYRQVRATRRLIRLFMPLREKPPARLQSLLKAHQLPEDKVIFLNLTAVHAFCLGFWQPRIWLTAGLVDLLSEQELAAVVAHEVHHYRRRDPLRLLISRALKTAFFFLPLAGALARAAEVQQEVAADRWAISYLGDDLPLLCALQKLLRRSGQPDLNATAAYSPFNVTEARLHRLIYPPPPLRWRSYFPGFLVNLIILIILSGTVFLSSIQPIIHQAEVDSCSVSPVNSPHNQASLLDELRRYN
jgi:Zn-dependent protease with chaperone function